MRDYLKSGPLYTAPNVGDLSALGCDLQIPGCGAETTLKLALSPCYGLCSGMEDFARIDAHAVHGAMIEAEHQAKERQDTMPSSAEALANHAKELYAVREKILDRLPAEVRLTYPPKA